MVETTNERTLNIVFEGFFKKVPIKVSVDENEENDDEWLVRVWTPISPGPSMAAVIKSEYLRMTGENHSLKFHFFYDLVGLLLKRNLEETILMEENRMLRSKNEREVN